MVLYTGEGEGCELPAEIVIFGQSVIVCNKQNFFVVSCGVYFVLYIVLHCTVFVFTECC